MRTYPEKTLLTCAFALCFLCALAGAQHQDTDAPALVEKYCIDCHDSITFAGDLDLDTLDAANPAADPEVWERAIRKLWHRQMPPPGKRRPDEAGYASLIAHLESSIDAAAAAHPNPGRADTFRRLTRAEYKNAIRDLLALDIDVAALLPKDEVSHGFDNITVGALSPTRLERYLAAAKKISRLAIGAHGGAPIGHIYTVPLDLTQESHVAGMPFGTRGGAAFQHTFPVDAVYEVRLKLMRDRNEEVEGLKQAHDVVLLVDGEVIQTFGIKPPGRGHHDKADRHLKARFRVTAGPHEVCATFIEKSPVLIESERQPYLAHFNRDRHPRIQPALYSITVLGPYEASGHGESPSRARLFPCYPANAAEEDDRAKTIIAALMRRAYRRPVTEDDLEAPLRFYREAKAEQGFEAGIETALRAILVSPHFLFRIERDPAGVPANSAYRVSDVALASRLSFFLWSSIPDDALLDAAEAGILSRPGVLEGEVRRMLADPRADALTTNFAAQWLYLRNLDSARPNPRLFLDFDDNLRQAMRRETELLFESIHREDRSVLDFLRADYTFVNERLAKHYGIPNIYGSRFRRIPLEDGGERGGLLRQASMLTVTSFANRTSPVMRGKWVLTNILGTPPKPPPPEVPELEESTGGVGSLSLRDRIAEHRKDRVCASCHNALDPVGLALENYDAIGRWRTEDQGVAIDATGALADGSAFDGAGELQRAILKRPEIFVTTVTEKLLTYALGRGLEAYDAPAVRKIVRGSAASEYRFSALVLGIAQSTPFQMRMPP